MKAVRAKPARLKPGSVHAGFLRAGMLVGYTAVGEGAMSVLCNMRLVTVLVPLPELCLWPCLSFSGGERLGRIRV